MATTINIIPNYKPHAKQLLLHNAPVSWDDLWVILYGGARGGGKSAGGLADAFLFCQAYPGAKVCIIRESLDAVKQSFLDKLPTLFPQYVDGIQIYDYKEKSSSWYPSRSIVFPNGSYITLQRVANYQEAIAKQGWEFHYLIIDECTKQDKRTLEYLLTCVRSSITYNNYTKQYIRIPTKVMLGANPGGVGHTHIKERFIDTTVVKVDENGTPIQTKDSVELIPDPQHPGKFIKRYIRFIPASYKDNPYLNPSYVANLMSLPEYKRNMDLYGNWNIVAGKMFELNDEQKITPRDANMLIKEFSDKDMIEIFISIDWGFKPSFASAHWHAVLPDHRVLTFQELYVQDLIFEDFVKEIAKMSEGMYISATCLPHDMFRGGDRYRDETGKIVGEMKADVFNSAGLNPISVLSGKGNVELRYDKIHSACSILNEDGVYKFRISTACPMLLEEFDTAVHSDIDPTQLDKRCRDHALDDYGLFLIMYSDDIEPIGQEAVFKDNRTSLQRLIEDDEKHLEEQEADEYTILNDDMFSY